MSDLISRQAAVIQLSHNKIGDGDYDVIIQRDIETIKRMPSAEPQIIYQYCEKALMKLWDDGIIFFCEYDRIMDRLKKRMEVDHED